MNMPIWEIDILSIKKDVLERIESKTESNFCGFIQNIE